MTNGCSHRFNLGAWPAAQVLPFGSAFTTLAESTDFSDLDLCLVLPTSAMAPSYSKETKAVQVCSGYDCACIDSGNS